MRLASFRVGPYRNVLDTETITVDERVTVLVGKNESGKTNLLHALDGLNPANGPREFSKHEYPRWLQKKHERSGQFSEAHAVDVTFALEDADKEAVSGKFGEGVLLDSALRAYRSYESGRFQYYQVKVDEAVGITNALTDLDITHDSDLPNLRASLATEASEVDAEGESTPKAATASAAIKRLDERFGSHDSVAVAVSQLLHARIPRFFYFDDLDQLPGTVSDIKPLIKALTAGSLDDLSGSTRTAAKLLQMGYAGEDLTSVDYVQRKAELQAVGADLTRDVMEYWQQNPSLRLEVDINPVEEAAPNGTAIVRRELKLDVNDSRHLFSNSLDSRSSGFRWFISFIAAFGEFEQDANVIVLLDEPGLGLHGKAQADFLRFINERVALHHQVIFTTHSPFMVDPARLERVRVVEDMGPETGTKVTTADVGTSDPDTLFPLQAALGYDIAQNLFVGPDNLVVEGLSDFTYLTVLSEHLQSLDREGLDDRWRILPAGSAANIPTFVALVGPSLDVTVLIDGGESSNQRIQNMVQAGLLKDKRLISPAAISSVKDADIEDLFTPADYLALYNGAFGSTVTLTQLKGKDRIVKRIERAVEAFDHNKTARHLLRNRDTLAASLSDDTLNAFEGLFKQINSTLS